MNKLSKQYLKFYSNCTPRTTCFCGTYRALYAASRLSKQLRLGVFHLGSVENLLALHLVQVQETVELHGGWRKKGRICDTGTAQLRPSSITQHLLPSHSARFLGWCQFWVSDGSCVRVCLTKGEVSEIVADCVVVYKGLGSGVWPLRGGGRGGGGGGGGCGGGRGGLWDMREGRREQRRRGRWENGPFLPDRDSSQKLAEAWRAG